MHSLSMADLAAEEEGRGGGNTANWIYSSFVSLDINVENLRQSTYQGEQE